MRRPFVLLIVALAGALVAAGVAAYSYWFPDSVPVAALRETSPVFEPEDAADDPAVWIDPRDPSRSVVVGTDKRGGMHVFDLEGRELQHLANGGQNNVDLRDGFDLGGSPVVLVLATANRLSKVVVYRLDEASRMLVRLVASTLRVGIDAEGIALYRSPQSGKTYFFVTGDDSLTGEDGIVEQWELGWDAAHGRVVSTLARRFDVGEEIEGCACDDGLGFFYVSEEETAVWRYGAEPDAPSGPDDRVAIDRLGRGGRLRYNSEGIAIRERGDGTGWLAISSQGSNDFTVYDRAPPHAYRGRFRVDDGNGIDEVTHTDGIEIAAALPGPPGAPHALGPLYPEGVFVAQDDANDGGANQNFKLVGIAEIETALGLR